MAQKTFPGDLDNTLPSSMPPTAHHATHEPGGSDPITGIAPGAHHLTHEPEGSDPLAVDAAAAIGSLRTLGTGANQACAGNDARLSDARTPLIHGSGAHTGIIGIWGQIDKTVSNLGDLTTKSHTSLTDKGVTTHADIDSFIQSSLNYVNYSAISTVVGWSSFYYKDIFYKKIGTFMHVTFYLHGECNSAAASFTLPFNANAPGFTQGLVLVEDNYTWQPYPGMFEIVQGSNVVHFYKNCAKAAFTASGQKGVAGQFFYEVLS